MRFVISITKTKFIYFLLKNIFHFIALAPVACLIAPARERSEQENQKRPFLPSDSPLITLWFPYTIFLSSSTEIITNFLLNFSPVDNNKEIVTLL